MLILFKNIGELRVISDQYGSPTHTTNVAKLIDEIISKESKQYGIYHFSNSGETNWFEFSKEIIHRNNESKKTLY